MKYLFLCVMMFFISMTNCVYSQNIDYVTVESKGAGSNYTEAVNSALSNAIAMVNGKSIEGNTMLKKISESLVTSEKREYYSSKKFEKTIKEITKGFVDSFKIINESTTEAGRIKILISAKIGKYVLKKSAKRKRIAVLPIYYNKSQYPILDSFIDGSKIDRLFTQNLVSYLVQTRKFTVLEREYMRALDSEISVIKRGETQIEEVVKLGQKIFADYILVSYLEEFSALEEEIKLKTSTKKIKTKNGIIEYNYRIIDVPTSQIMYSNDYRGRHDLNSMINETSVESAMVKLATLEIGRDILNAIYPLRIEKIDGNMVYIGQGGMELEVDKEFHVYELGEKIKDSYTNVVIGRVEKKVAKIKIIDVGAKLSTGKIIEENYHLNDQFELKKYILKPIKKEKMSAIDIAKEKIKKMKGSDAD